MLDNHLVRLRAQNNLLCFVGFQEKDKKINLSLLVPREFDINPRVIPRGENSLSYTIHSALGVST